MQLDICRNKIPVIVHNYRSFAPTNMKLLAITDISRSFIMLGLPYFDMMCAMKNYVGKVKKVKNAKMQLQEFYSETSILP